MNQMLGDKLKSFTGGGGEGDGKAGAEGKETAESKGMSREEFEEYQKQMVEEKWVNLCSIGWNTEKQCLKIMLTTAKLDSMFTTIQQYVFFQKSQTSG